MTTLQEAAQQALDYWQQVTWGDAVMVDKMDALRAALAQEPSSDFDRGFQRGWRRAMRDRDRDFAMRARVEETLAALMQEQAQTEPDAYDYASRLAIAIWEKHYKANAPDWKPLDDLMGVLTQIDNMTAGLTRPAQPETNEQEPVYWEVRCTAHPKWMRVDEQQFDEYVAHGWEGQKLYAAPPKIETTQEPAAWQDTAKPTELVASEDWENIDPVWHWMYRPLYSHPLKLATLTDEEIEACRQQGYAHNGLNSPFDFGKAARAVERALKEKSGQSTETGK